MNDLEDAPKIGWCCDKYHQLIAQRVTERAESLGRLIDYIEVGVLTGNSAAAILGTCKVRSAILIDNFSMQLNGENQSKRKVEQRLSKYDGLFEVVEGESCEVLRRMIRLFDIGFVDGDHTGEGCRSDLENMLPLMREGGIIFVHDVLNPYFKNLKDVSETFAAKNNLSFTLHAHVEEGLAELRRKQ